MEKEVEQKNDALPAGLNTLEANVERDRVQLDEAQAAKREAWVSQAQPAAVQQRTVDAPFKGNQVESDEIFTAEQRDIRPALPPEVEREYLRVGDKFYRPQSTDQIAFEDRGKKLETRSNSEQIAENLVRIAQSRGWDEIKVSGSETFRREAWLAAAALGMHVTGYTPSDQDLATLAKRRGAIRADNIEAGKASTRSSVKNDGDKSGHDRHLKIADTFTQALAEAGAQKHPELAGAYAAIAMMDKKAQADGLTDAQRAVVAARVRRNVVNSIERGEFPSASLREQTVERAQQIEAKELAR